MLTEKVDSPTKKIGTLLEQVHQLFVPRYQRGYAWEEEQVEAYVEDLFSLTNQRLEDAPDEAHFFGSIVTVGRPDPRTDSIRYEIVDGQQRITTSVLLLAAIADAFEKIGGMNSDAHDPQLIALAKRADTKAEEIRTRYLRTRVFDGPSDFVPKLISNKSDNDILQQLVNKGTAIAKRDSHTLLLNAYNYLNKNLIFNLTKMNDNEERMKNLDALRSALTSDCYLIHVITESKSSANRLFSVLNNRGKQIGPSDLLRADLMESLENYPAQQEKVAHTWDVLTVDGEDKLDRFFLAYYPSIKGRRCKESYYAEYSENVFNFKLAASVDSADAKVKFVEVLSEEFAVYKKIVEGSWPFAANNQGNAWDVDRLDRLVNVLRHALAVPLLLSAARTLEETEFSQLVHSVELFAFRYKNICNGHAASASKAYYDAAQSCREGTYNQVSFAASLRKLISESADDATFKLKLTSQLLYSKPTQRQNIRELLTTLEDYNAWTAKAKMSIKPSKSRLWVLSEVDIEHIYPQTAKTTQNSMENLKHTIGNLTFWDKSDNRAQGNAEFATKKVAYAKSAVSSNRRISNLPDWDASQVASRQTEIVEAACRVFDIH
ncbi:DUF262 domain-containing protein [Rhodococcoides fascians]|uniref:DUF262 domain-containing protein n=1 Tax=Rhodococcoides fascians TaxID=1828 RepID=UPI00050CF0FB|nr:DUF262 domain-containing protein [Rhodococcus fascians]